MSKKSSLGRGLESLIPKDFDTSLMMQANERIQNVLISDIHTNPDQPRRQFDQGSLIELSESILKYGVIQPVIVSPIANNKFILVAGERRYRASKIANLDRIPAIVRDRQELEQLEVALIENVQRVDLSAIEQALSIERLHHQFNVPYAEIAKRLSKAETTVSNIVRLLQLPPIMRDALQMQQITEGHARALLSIKHDENQQQTLFELILKNGLSVRQAEQYATSVKSDSKKPSSVAKHTETNETKHLAKRLKAKVQLKRTAKGGRLEIHFETDDELQHILDQLKG